jgi:hypothetical protein
MYYELMDIGQGDHGRGMQHAWDVRNANKILVGKPEGKRLFGRSRYRWEDDIIMDLTGIRCRSVAWFHLA